MSNQFEGKVAVITGGSSGIGRATAVAFAAEGARVAVGARRAAESEETIRLIQAQGGEAIFVPTDVTHADQVQKLMDAAVSRWQRLDVAFNNAGIGGTSFVPTPDYSEQVWDDVIDINLKGIFLAMKYEIPHMLKSGGGAIVNMSSVAGLIGGPIGIAYYASKHGVIGATKAAAMEYAKKGIRVNAVCPAVIRTAMSEEVFNSEQEERALALHPMGRFGTTEEVAEAVVFLCSNKASFITGHALPVDAGLLAR
ncbi:MAG: 3-oxoacyl-(acyl-carrier-protein) reductase [Bryobacterales bacterium]|nr:3-oxoacyl-(acyl-carrier-protein) reductase [Bryobacterales bacterium]